MASSGGKAAPKAAEKSVAVRAKSPIPPKPVAGKPSAKPVASKPANAAKGAKPAVVSRPVAARPVAASSVKPEAAKSEAIRADGNKSTVAKLVVGKGAVPPKPPAVSMKKAPGKGDAFAKKEMKPVGGLSAIPQQARPVIETVSSSDDSRPKKNQAGFSSKELEHFRDLLLEKRRELVGDMNSMEREALQASESNLSTLPIHMADMGTDNYEQEFTLGLVEKDRGLLREINHALAKIQNGTYGICEGSGKPIPKVRLEYQPWARHSIEYARMKEKHQFVR